MFRIAGAALTRLSTAPVKHGGGSRVGGMVRPAARAIIGRVARFAPEAFRNAAMIARRTTKASMPPAVFLSDTLDWLQVWRHDEPAAGDDLAADGQDVDHYEAGPNHLSPGL